MLNNRSAFAQASDLLDRERTSLKLAEFDRLSELAAEKELFLASLSKPPPFSEAELRALKSKEERNQILFSAALDGLRDVSVRLSEFRANMNGFSTYDQSGARAKMVTGSVSTRGTY